MYNKSMFLWGFPGSSDDNLPAMPETRVQYLGQEDPLEKGMAIHSTILAWRIQWKEEPDGLQFMGYIYFFFPRRAVVRHLLAYE